MTTEEKVLEIVRENRRIHLDEISKLSGLHLSTCTQYVGKLEKKGMVKRYSDGLKKLVVIKN